MMKGVAALAALVFAIGISAQKAQAGLNEDGMSQQDYKDLYNGTYPDSSTDPGWHAAPIHDLDDATTQTFKDSKAQKPIKGKDWKAMDLQQRRDAIEDLNSRLPEDSIILVEVPKGNVWVVKRQVVLDAEKANKVRAWTRDQYTRLPLNRPDPSGGQDDRRGIRLEPKIQLEKL